MISSVGTTPRLEVKNYTEDSINEKSSISNHFCLIGKIQNPQDCNQM